MKPFILMAFLFCNFSWASQVETDCAAMNQSREKSAKLTPVKKQKSKTVVQ